MLQIESKPDFTDSLPLSRDPDSVRRVASAALVSEEPSAEEDFESISKTLIENLALVSGTAELKKEARIVATAAAYLYVSASLSDPVEPARMADTLVAVVSRAEPEWRAKAGELRGLLAIAFDPSRALDPSATSLERTFHDAVVALDADKEPRNRPALLDGGVSEKDRLAREIKRLRGARFATVLGHLHFGKRLDKNIEELEDIAGRFGITSGGAANQKMTLSIYRSVSRNMIDMLTLADRKAGLLLNANAISLTVLVAFFGRNLSENPKLWASSVLIAGTCALTVLFASLAARPIRRDKKQISLEQFHAEGHSLLHYGDVARLDKESFYEGFQRLARDPALLERNMLSEMHFFSTRIIDKFAMVRRAYLTMIAGILMSCLALLFSHFA